MRHLYRLAPASLLALACGCGPQAPNLASPTEVQAVLQRALPSSPDDAAWASVPVHPATLILQDMVEPRLLKPSTTALAVRALTDGKDLVFALSWPDATRDDLPDAARFADACAVQLPQTPSADVPAPQMGEARRSVEISYWSAFFQATVDGRPDDIHALYPNAKVDHYPFEAAPLPAGSPEQQAAATRYAPARALGNTMAGPREQPVQDLLAEGPGTLRPAPIARSTGKGVHDATGWRVLIRRPLPQGVAIGGRTQVAFAVWQGRAQEVGARKMRTAWIPLAVGGAADAR